MRMAQKHLMRKELLLYHMQLSFQLNAADYRRLCVTVDPLSPSNNYGIDLYEQVIQFIDSL